MKINSQKVCIYGFGRMGLTHFAILNSLGNYDFTFIDVDWKMNLLTRKNINASILKSDEDLKDSSDLSLVCTPPMFHISSVKKCLDRGDKIIFVEKPFGGPNDDLSHELTQKNNIYVGYVMRFNPIVQWIKNNIDSEQVATIKAQYISNTIEKKPGGWRNGSYSGVLNEMGSHIIDLCHYLFDLTSVSILERKLQSVVSDVDDIAALKLKTFNHEVDLFFNWVDKSARKPMFSIELTFKNGDLITFDQQKVDFHQNGNLVNSISVVDLSPSVPYYLRGIDFTSQMQDLISDQKIIAKVSDAMITRQLINEVLSR